MNKNYFITATDTDAGKTYICTGLLKAANAVNLDTIGMKPVASGCFEIDGKLYNPDALQLQQAATLSLEYSAVNPICYKPATAPHIAASQSGDPLSVKRLIKVTTALFKIPCDLRIIEGFGGWHAPLNHQETMADYVNRIQCEVIMVVALRLGCINHAILTEQAIRSSGSTCIGWIANIINPDMENKMHTIHSLQAFLQSPLLAAIQFNEPADQALQKTNLLF